MQKRYDEIKASAEPDLSEWDELLDKILESKKGKVVTMEKLQKIFFERKQA